MSVRRSALVVLFLLVLGPMTAPAEELYHGPDTTVLLQGFHWRSHNYPWYRILKDNAQRIKDAGFTYVWFPPPSATADAQGYLPTQWYDLDTRYGTGQELRDAIAALRPVGAIADIVVNHRCGRHGWADFDRPHFGEDGASPPQIAEANHGAVCRNDEWGGQPGGAPAGGHDSGDGFDGGRDLDHARWGVRRRIIEWLTWLKMTVGFVGWRWDMVKGYHARYVGIYNDATQPAFSVGEYWDEDRQRVVDWVNRTYGRPDRPDHSPDRAGGRSTAFDFPTRALLKRAIETNDYSVLRASDGRPAGMIGWWGRMAVTFVDNHDTEDGHHRHHLPGHRILEAYAYILTHPGKPCVFWRHFFDWGDTARDKIKAMIALRREAGVHAASAVVIHKAEWGHYAAVVGGRLAVKIGPRLGWEPGSGWRLALDGPNFAIWRK